MVKNHNVVTTSRCGVARPGGFFDIVLGMVSIVVLAQNLEIAFSEMKKYGYA